MNADAINRAVVASIQDSAIPRVDRDKILAIFGAEEGNAVADEVEKLVREAVSMPIEWGNMTLAEGVKDILSRFQQRYPELSPEALHEIGRCVGWQLR